MEGLRLPITRRRCTVLSSGFFGHSLIIIKHLSFDHHKNVRYFRSDSRLPRSETVQSSLQKGSPTHKSPPVGINHCQLQHLCCVVTTHIINSIITISIIIILIILIIITTIIMIITLTVMMMPRCEVHQGVEAEVQCKAHQGGTGDPAARFLYNS